jgi:Bacterial archaeo-eukaryotic release factor family 5
MAHAVLRGTLASMALMLMERARDVRGFVGSVLELRDPIGVLSVTVGIEPGAGSGRTPPWEIALENDLTRLRHDGSLGASPKKALDVISARLAEVLDPASTGRGRALYVALESGASREITLQKALPTAARVGPVAHVLPVLEALDRGEPALLIMASRDAIVLFESELGSVSEVDRIELEPWVGDWWPEMKGPSRANPLRGQQTVSQRDRYERRMAAAYRHTLDDAAARLGVLARKRRWTRAVLAGDSRTVDSLDRVLRECELTTTTLRANLEGLRTEDALGRLDAALEALVTEEQARLAENVVSASAGVCGLVPVLAALNEARVARLLIDANRAFAGVVEAEILAAAGPDEEDAPDLTDLIVARALATDAAVTPLYGEAARTLAACEGIAALLRW